MGVDSVLLLLSWGRVVVEDTAWCSDGVVGGVRVSWFVRNADLHVVVLRMPDDVFGDEVGVDFEMVVCQSGVLMRRVD